MPRGVPHGYFNKSDKPARALFWASPARNLRDLFKVLHNMSDVEAVIRASAEHEVDFLRRKPTIESVAIVAHV